MYLSSRFRKKNAIVSLLLVFMFLMSIIVAPHADALNAGSGSKENSFVGYRYLNSTQIQIWADKNIGSTFYPGQYKIYEGNDPSIGQQIDVASVAAGSGPNVSGITGLSGGGSIKITSAEAFMPGHVYTIVVTNTLKSNNGLTLGHVNNHKDIAFSFVAPDTPATPNVNGTYSSITPIMNNWPANNATNVPVEGLISFSLNVPMDNATASAFSNWTAKTSTLVLKKDGIPVIYDYSINSSPDGSIYAPIVSDDRTFVFFPMTGGGSSLSCNLDFNTSYTLEIPEIHLINGQTIPAQTISFTTASDDVPAAFSSKPTMSTTGDNLSFSWQTINAVTGAWPAATGYNVWASTDPYFNFIKLNSTPISAPTTSYDYDVSGLQPSTEYYFRVTAINGSAEGGFSDYVQATTPAAVTGTISNPSTTGFTLSLNPSVVGLVYGDFSLNNGGTVTDVNTTDNGATYNATANLSAGQTYTVAITKPGYTFNVANVIVPGTSTTVTGTISNPSTTGFTLSLNPSVAGLVYGDFSLNNGGTVTDVITTDNGATYNVTANLSAGQIYTVNINTAGYTFNIGNLVVPGGGGSTDTQAPTWTNNTFKVATKTGQEIKLEWYAATDNVGVTGYKIYQGSDLIGSVDENTTTFTYTVPSGSGTGQQTYSVQAGDAAGNWSTNGPSQTIGGKNLPLITEYGVYSYSPSSNTTPPSAIGSIKTSSPWKLSQVSCDFDSNVGIGIKFATNVAVDTYFSDNADIIQMLDASNNSVSIKVDRSGDGTSSDQNRNYLFVMPLESLKPGSSYKIIVGSTLTSNNGMQAGVEQEVEFTTTGTPETPVVGTITTDGPTYTNGTGSVDPAVGAIVGLGDSAKVVIPASTIHKGMTILWWTHFLSVFSLCFIVPRSKHLHLVFAPFNVYWHTLAPKGALNKIQINGKQGETFGANKMDDFTWKQLFDAYSCTKCGRCNGQCPAQLSGEALKPKALNGRLRKHIEKRAPLLMKKKTSLDTAKPVLGAKKQKDKKSGEGKSKNNLAGEVFDQEFIWSCTTCGACMEVCPVSIEHTSKIIDLRRYLVLTKENISDEMKQTFTRISEHGNPWDYSYKEDPEWAKELAVPTIAENLQAEYLYYAGCAATFDETAQKTAAAFVKILKAAGVNFAILGSLAWCCGETSRRMGNEFLFEKTVNKNISTLNELGIKKIITTCPHCFNTLKNEYPQYGGEYEVIHHSVFLADLLREGKLVANKSFNQLISYHDPCYLGRYNDLFSQPRDVLKAVPDVRLTEMPRSQKNSFCCGAGGGRIWNMPVANNFITDNRVKEAISTEAEVIGTACPFCKMVFSEAIKSEGSNKNMKVLDIAEILASSL